MLTAFLLGLFTSLHCIGMCGPIAMALPSLVGKKAGKIGGPILYNMGRVLTYITIGLVFGWIGRGFSVAGWQQGLSLFIGLTILFSVLLPGKYWNQVLPYGHWNRILSGFQKRIRKLNSRAAFLPPLLVGMVNGLLPCGAVYLGIAGSITMESAGMGALFMLYFGLGTFPLMMMVAMGSHWVSGTVKGGLRKAFPYFAFALGLLLILRGLDLGIPFISPILDGIPFMEESRTCYSPR